MKVKKRNIILLITYIVIEYLQINSIYYHLGKKDNTNWVVIVLLIYPLWLLNKKFITLWCAQKNTFKNILCTLIMSVICYVSIFLPYLNSFKVDYIVTMIGYIVLFFILLYTFSACLNNIEWQEKIKKNSLVKFLLYLTIPLVVYTIGMLANYPGLLSPDSLYVWSIVSHNGPYDNLHPLLYLLTLRFLYNIGFNIWGIMVIQCLLCALTYTYIVYKFDIMGLSSAWCVIGLVLLTIYPLNLMNTITFWKDVPYTMGLALLTIELIRITKDKLYFKSIRNILILLFSLTLILISRHNGMFIVALTFLIAIIVLLIKKNKRLVIRCSVILLVSIVLYYGTLNIAMYALGDKYKEPEENNVLTTSKYALSMQGLVGLYEEKWDVLDKKDKEFISNYIDLKKLDEHLDKYRENEKWRYWSRTKAYVKAEQLVKNPNQYIKGYINLLKKHPYDMVNAYLKTTAIIWSAPELGYTTHCANPYTFRDRACAVSYGIEIGDKSFLPKIKHDIFYELYMKMPCDSWYALLWRSAFYMLIIIFFLWRAVKRKGGISLIVVLPVIINSLGYLIMIEAQDSRYTYINFTVALIMIAYSLINNENQTIKKNPNMYSVK